MYVVQRLGSAFLVERVRDQHCAPFLCFSWALFWQL